MDWEILTWQVSGMILLVFALGIICGLLFTRLFGETRTAVDDTALSARDEEIKDLKAQILNDASGAAALKTDLSRLQTENVDLKEQITRFAGTTSENLSLLKENESLKNQIENAGNGAENEYKTENLRLKARITAIENSAKADLKAYRAEINRLKINNPVFESETAAKLSITKNENANLKAKIFSLQTDLSDLKTRLAVVTSTSSVSKKAAVAAASRFASPAYSEHGFRTSQIISNGIDDGFSDDCRKIRERLDALELLATDEEEDTEENLSVWMAETESLQAEIEALKDKVNSENRETRRTKLAAAAASLGEFLRKSQIDKTEGIAKIRRQSYGRGIRDDLKEIEGIGPVLEKFLNDLDIWTFEQIADWTPEKTSEVSNYLPSFKDRIVREDWVGQSRELYSKYYE